MYRVKETHKLINITFEVDVKQEVPVEPLAIETAHGITQACGISAQRPLHTV